MSRASPQIRHLASLIVTNEGKGQQRVRREASAAFHALSALGPHLSPLIGSAGFQALLARACAIAKREVPSLAAVQVNPDGSLEGFDDAEARITAEQLAEGESLLLAELLGLLITFIGENLTLRMVHEVWPKLAFKDADFCQGVEQ